MRRSISREEEVVLVKRFQAGDRAAGETLVRVHARRLAAIAAPYLRAVCDREALMQEIAIGFLDGFLRYEEGHGTRPATYATWWARAAATEHLKNDAGIIKIPDHLFSTQRRARAKEAVLLAAAEARRVLSIDTPLHGVDEEGPTVGSYLTDDAPPVDTEIADREQVEAVRRVVASVRVHLSPLEADLLDRRLLDADDERTLQEIGEHHGVSRERTRQVELVLKGKLRRAFARADFDGHP